MTLYSWMHWFWITIVMASVCLCNPLSSKVGPDLEEPIHNAAEITTPEVPYKETNSRTGKAIGHSPKTPIPIIFSTPIPYQRVSIVFPLPTSSDTEDEGPSFQREISQRINYKKIEETHEDMIQTDPPSITTISSISSTEISATSNESKTVNNTIDTPILKSENLTMNETVKSDQNVTSDEKNKTTDVDKDTTQSNTTETEELATTTERVIKNDSVNIVDGDDEPEVSTVRALSLETAVGRRAVEEPIAHVTTHISPDRDEGLDAAGISGICFGTLVLLALTGAISFVLYRRRYLNKPQTLNDKCSNPDSSGYIDDSTIRENSEEMYSLDNDSFLNSLEAMTIQNYWTDSVKHTKL